MTTSMAIVIFWDQRKFTKTVKLDRKLNIAMMNTAPEKTLQNLPHESGGNV